MGFRIRRKATSSLLAGAMYFVIVAVAVLLALQIGKPAFSGAQDTAALTQANDALNALDAAIAGVSSESAGSVRIISLQIKSGKVLVASADDKIYYYLDPSASGFPDIAIGYPNRSIDLEGSLTLYRGSYELMLLNRGTGNGKTIVEIKKK